MAGFNANDEIVLVGKVLSVNDDDGTCKVALKSNEEYDTDGMTLKIQYGILKSTYDAGIIGDSQVSEEKDEEEPGTTDTGFVVDINDSEALH